MAQLGDGSVWQQRVASLNQLYHYDDDDYPLQKRSR
jgi:hypothetical protein